MGAPTSLLIDHAAAFLGVSRRTIYYRIHEGLLRTVRTRCGSLRVTLESLEEQRRTGRRRRHSTAIGGTETEGSESEPLLF